MRRLRRLTLAAAVASVLSAPAIARASTWYLGTWYQQTLCMPMGDIPPALMGPRLYNDRGPYQNPAELAAGFRQSGDVVVDKSYAPLRDRMRVFLVEPPDSVTPLQYFTVSMFHSYGFCLEYMRGTP